MENTVLEKFHQGRQSLGTFSAIGSPLAVESLRYTGLDYVIVDTEHSPAGIESAAAQIAAAQGAGLTALARANEISRTAGSPGAGPVCQVRASGEPGLLPHPGRRLGPRRPCGLHFRLYGDQQPGDAAAAPVRNCGLPGAH